MTRNAFPHAPLVSSSEIPLHRNELYGIVIQKPPTTGRFEVFRAGVGEAHIVTRLADAQSAYARLWMEAAAVGIGLGFHPDTPAASYEPALEPALAAQYDDMIGFCHKHLDDPYAVGMEAWEKAGLVDPAPSPSR